MINSASPPTNPSYGKSQKDGGPGASAPLSILGFNYDSTISKQRPLPVIGCRRHRLAWRGLLRRLRLLGRHLLRRDRQDQLRIVIGDAIDPCGDFMPDELALVRRLEQRPR